MFSDDTIGLSVIAVRLPPARCGVGDYTYQLWSRWPDGAQTWRFLVKEGAEQTRQSTKIKKVTQVEASSKSIFQELEKTGTGTVLLQYAPYGYDSKGAPVWLYDGLRCWKAVNSGRHLVVMFHEIFAHSAPWRRSFYRANAQRRVISDLGRLSEVSLTSTPWFAQQLGKCGVEAKICPVPANVPKVDSKERRSKELRVVIFGLPDKRAAALKTHSQFVQMLDRLGRLEKLVVIGKGLRAGQASDPEARRLGLETGRVEIAGELPAQEVAALLADADLLLSPHGPRDILKSGSCAAALLNGCALVVRGKDSSIQTPALLYDGSRSGARTAAQEATRTSVEALRTAGQVWYQRHASWSSCIAVWSNVICSLSN